MVFKESSRFWQEVLAVASLLLILVAALLAAHTPALQNSPRCSGALGILVFAAVLAATLLLVSQSMFNFNNAELQFALLFVAII